MSESERTNLKELCENFKKLSEQDQLHLLWMSQGILFASVYSDGANR